MEYRRCQPPCARFIASDDPHSKCVKCLGFSHAREAIYGISKCKFSEDLSLRTLRFWLEVLRKGLSFMVAGVTSSRPSRHPKSGMSSSARHSASSIAFHSRMGVPTRGIALGSPHSLARLHTSVWEESTPCFDGVQLTVVNSTSKASVLQQELSVLSVLFCSEKTSGTGYC